MRMNKQQLDDQRFDNSDVLTPSSALEFMTEKVMGILSTMCDLSSLQGTKKGKTVADVPLNISSRTINETYRKVLRRLPIKPADAPHIPTIIEEFEVAAVTAYRNKSHHIYYIEAMALSFLNNSILEIGNHAIGYELHHLNTKIDANTAATGYVVALDNVLRFHPLYTAYLYGVSGDPVREELIIKEVCEQLVYSIG